MPDMDIRVKRLDISDGLFGFADFVIEPNFEADIQSLSGSITNITTNPDELTQVELEGFVVDRFSPATVSGTMDVFGYDRQTDMKVSFRNIELPVFNPYSGRYAGYAIARGKLSADFHYQIENRALDAERCADHFEVGDVAIEADLVVTDLVRAPLAADVVERDRAAFGQRLEVVADPAHRWRDDRRRADADHAAGEPHAVVCGDVPHRLVLLGLAGDPPG